MQQTDDRTHNNIPQHKHKHKIVNQVTTLGYKWDLAIVIFIAVM